MLIIFGVIAVILLAGIFLTGGNGGEEESVQVVMRDAVLHDVNKVNFFGLEINPGLVAGFVETGETLEECVQREVWEETHLRITNIRYFASQPWPYPCGLMVGFNADYVSGDIHLQRSEIAKGGWFRKDNLPTIPEKLSIARMLLDAWTEE